MCSSNDGLCLLAVVAVLCIPQETLKLTLKLIDVVVDVGACFVVHGFDERSIVSAEVASLMCSLVSQLIGSVINDALKVLR